ncbi:MAG: hypothetical protein J6A33_05685 [Alphaproteobacteria bacterium]|nr:hypothetical protein [Alphaproteobacteria bacterium]
MQNNFIPYVIQSKAISLNPIGVSGDAFSYPDTITLLSFCKDNNIAILGGDVLAINNDKISYTYDNWYINTEKYSSYSELVKESYNISLNYLINILQEAQNLYYHLVFCINEEEFNKLKRQS